MVLRLHVLGPAFGLASIDAECLAAITYLAYAVPQTEYELVATSASAVPTHSLPALQDTTTTPGTWTTGFTSIAAYLSTSYPLRGLTPSQQADTIAYTAFLTSTAASLIALVADLNIDDQPKDERKRQEAEDSRGWLRSTHAGVRAALAPEHAAVFRLEAAAVECLSVLADLKGREDDVEGRFMLEGEGGPSALDCLAFAYLALMLVPEVPRPWLQNLMRARYDCLCVFVDGIRDELFGGDVASLPWATAGVEGEPWRVTRFARGVVEAAVPGDWLLAESSVRDEGEPWAGKKKSSGAVALAALVNSVAGLGLVGGVLLYRHLSPFGSMLYRWEVSRTNYGAAGALLGI